MVKAMAIAVASQWLFQLPVAWLLARAVFNTADGIWWSFAVTNIAAAIATAIMLKLSPLNVERER
jgi:Na+-driven multidrug efflux pump